MDPSEGNLPPALQAAGDNMNRLYGANLTAARKAAGLSLTALAGRAGMNAKRLRAIEAGTARDMVLSEAVTLALIVGRRDVAELFRE